MSLTGDSILVGDRSLAVVKEWEADAEKVVLFERFPSDSLEVLLYYGICLVSLGIGACGLIAQTTLELITFQYNSADRCFHITGLVASPIPQQVYLGSIGFVTIFCALILIRFGGFWAYMAYFRYFVRRNWVIFLFFLAQPVFRMVLPYYTFIDRISAFVYTIIAPLGLACLDYFQIVWAGTSTSKPNNFSVFLFAVSFAYANAEFYVWVKVQALRCGGSPISTLPLPTAIVASFYSFAIGVFALKTCILYLRVKARHPSKPAIIYKGACHQNLVRGDEPERNKAEEMGSMEREVKPADTSSSSSFSRSSQSSSPHSPVYTDYASEDREYSSPAPSNFSYEDDGGEAIPQPTFTWALYPSRIVTGPSDLVPLGGTRVTFALPQSTFGVWWTVVCGCLVIGFISFGIAGLWLYRLRPSVANRCVTIHPPEKMYLALALSRSAVLVVVVLHGFLFFFIAGLGKAFIAVTLWWFRRRALLILGGVPLAILFKILSNEEGVVSSAITFVSLPFTLVGLDLITLLPNFQSSRPIQFAVRVAMAGAFVDLSAYFAYKSAADDLDCAASTSIRPSQTATIFFVSKISSSLSSFFYVSLASIYKEKFMSPLSPTVRYSTSENYKNVRAGDFFTGD
jgi:hypothetical protein